MRQIKVRPIFDKKIPISCSPEFPAFRTGNKFEQRNSNGFHWLLEINKIFPIEVEFHDLEQVDSDRVFFEPNCASLKLQWTNPPASKHPENENNKFI